MKDGRPDLPIVAGYMSAAGLQDVVRSNPYRSVEVLAYLRDRGQMEAGQCCKKETSSRQDIHPAAEPITNGWGQLPGGEYGEGALQQEEPRIRVSGITRIENHPLPRAYEKKINGGGYRHGQGRSPGDTRYRPADK